MEFENLPTEWQSVKLEDISEMKYGKMPDKRDLTDNGYPIFSGYKITGYHQKYMYEDSKIVVVARGVGGTGDVKMSPKYSWITNLSIILNTNEKVAKDFLYFYLQGENLRILDSGSAQSQITIADLKNYPIKLPPLPQQQKIASILGALDDKIELNNKMNQTLETMAKALFKSWFVDFEPFADGEFEESELGMIPKGWKVGALEDITHIKNGFAFKSEDYTESGITVVRTKNFTDTGNVVFDDVVYLPVSFFESHSNYQLQIFDLLLVMVGASVGKMAMVYSNAIPSLQNQNMWNFRAKQDTHQFYVVYIVKKVVDENLHTASGSAREFFRKDYFKSIKVVIPSDDIITKFTSIVKPIYEQINSNICQIETLSTIRDSLLPKLMSGEIELAEV